MMGDALENNSECPSAVKSDADASAGGLSMLESSTQGNQEDGHVVFEDSGFAGHLQNGLCDLHLEERLTDVTLHVQGQRFSCHRVVLAAASHYFRSERFLCHASTNELFLHLCLSLLLNFNDLFKPLDLCRAMFCNDLREKHEESVNIKGLDADTMRILLEYTYTSKVTITKDNVQKTLEAASLFQVCIVTSRKNFVERGVALYHIDNNCDY